MNDRERDLEAIRATYARYEREGRQRIWDPSNPGYARMMRDRDLALVELLRRCLPSAGGRVLDLGSGDGRLAAVAREADLPIGTWVGVDLNPGVVAAAATAIPWAEFVEAAADRVPFPSDSFDVVVAATLFSSLPSPDLELGVAAEIERLLAPRGWLVWYDLRYANPTNRAVHGLGRGRLSELFPTWTAEVRSTTLLPPVARRLGITTPVLYSLLAALPPLRSHLVGRLQR